MLLASTAVLFAAQTDTSSDMEDITIPEGTEFKLQLHSTVNSKTSKPGDRVITTLLDPVMVEDRQVLARGLRIDGHIGEVKAARRRGKGGYLSVEFDTVEMPNGEKLSILGSLTEVFSGAEGSTDANVGPEGDLKGGGPSRKKQAAILAAPTAATAAITGSIPATIAVAAGAAVAAYWLPRGKQAVLEAGSLVGMRLDEDVTVSIPLSEK